MGSGPRPPERSGVGDESGVQTGGDVDVEFDTEFVDHGEDELGRAVGLGVDEIDVAEAGVRRVVVDDDAVVRATEDVLEVVEAAEHSRSRGRPRSGALDLRCRGDASRPAGGSTPPAPADRPGPRPRRPRRTGRGRRRSARAEPSVSASGRTWVMRVTDDAPRRTSTTRWQAEMPSDTVTSAPAGLDVPRSRPTTGAHPRTRDPSTSGHRRRDPNDRRRCDRDRRLARGEPPRRHVARPVRPAPRARATSSSISRAASGTVSSTKPEGRGEPHPGAGTDLGPQHAGGARQPRPPRGLVVGSASMDAPMTV